MIKRLSPETYGSDPGIFRSGGPTTERMPNYYNSSGDPMLFPEHVHPSLVENTQQQPDIMSLIKMILLMHNRIGDR